MSGEKYMAGYWCVDCTRHFPSYSEECPFCGCTIVERYEETKIKDEILKKLEKKKITYKNGNTYFGETYENIPWGKGVMN